MSTRLGAMSSIARMDGSIRVLYIEDSASDAALLRAALACDESCAKFDVAVESTLTQGLRRLEADRPDVVLLDLNLPDSNGFATFERLEHHARQLPVIIMTSIGGEAIAGAAVARGAQDYFHKHRLDAFWVSRAIYSAMGRFKMQRRLDAALDERGEFLSTLAHEIRSPLGLVIMATELASEQSGHQDAEVTELLRVIRSGGLHLKALIDDLLDLAKLDAAKFGFVWREEALVPLFEAAIDVAQPAFRSKGVALTSCFATDLPPTLESDRQRVRQVLDNLLSNALKFTDAGGHVRMNVAVDRRASALVVTVADDGCGIAAAAHDRLFLPFSQVGGGGQGGTGLGLSLARRLAEGLGGELELVSSAPGRGSVFRFTLATSAPVLSVAGSLAGLRVLLIDDSHDACLVSRKMLEADGAVVESAGDGRRGVEMALSERFDAAVLDLEMPGMGGLEAARTLRRSGSVLPLLALTAHRNGVVETVCREAGFRQVLSKPVSREELARAVVAAGGKATAKNTVSGAERGNGS